MPCYQVIMPGFKGTRDTVNAYDRVLWGLAKSKKLVRRAYPGCKVQKLVDVHLIEDVDCDFHLVD